MTETEGTDWRRLLSPDERARMLDDIARVSLAVGARLFPDQPWQDLDVAASSVATVKSPVERLGFIEQALPRLAQAVSQIARSPLMAGVSETRPVAPPLRARRIGTSALLQAARRGPTVRSLNETVTTVTRDMPENRAMRSFLWVLERDCAAIMRLAEAEGEAEAAERAVRCAARLSVLRHDSWWEEVGHDANAWTRPLSGRGRARPDYSQVGQVMRDYRAGFAFDWDQPTFALPPRETWRLYETWVLFTVLETLIGLGYQPAGDGTDLFTVRAGRLLMTLALGEPSRLALRSPSGRRLSLVYNQTFSQGDRSLSHAMQPDLTITSGETTWVLDAKFKPYALPGEEGEDINQMHAYRDAIVDAQGRRCVARAWCLYAGLTRSPNRPAITYGRSTDVPVGALCLRPGDAKTFNALRALLTAWLASAVPESPET